MVFHYLTHLIINPKRKIFFQLICIEGYCTKYSSYKTMYSVTTLSSVDGSWALIIFTQVLSCPLSPIFFGWLVGWGFKEEWLFGFVGNLWGLLWFYSSKSFIWGIPQKISFTLKRHPTMSLVFRWVIFGFCLFVCFVSFLSQLKQGDI